MNTKRVLVANEFRSYGEAVSLALRLLCPNADVFEVEHRYLTREVRRLRPDLVVCSEVSEVIKTEVPVWVELYPECGSFSEVCVEGERSTIEDLQLADLVEIVRRPRRAAYPR